MPFPRTNVCYPKHNDQLQVELCESTKKSLLQLKRTLSRPGKEGPASLRCIWQRCINSSEVLLSGPEQWESVCRDVPQRRVILLGQFLQPLGLIRVTQNGSTQLVKLLGHLRPQFGIGCQKYLQA